MGRKNSKYPKQITCLKRLVKEKYPKLDYHGADHGLDVWDAAKKYAAMANLEYEQKVILETAALLHDIIVIPGREDNEEESAKFANQYLPLLNYTPNQIREVEKLILATKMPQNPNGLLEKIICDSDLDNLGRNDFSEWGEKLRLEWEQLESADWYETQMKFLESHQYHTKFARQTRDTGKSRNIELLKQKLKELKC